MSPWPLSPSGLAWVRKGRCVPCPSAAPSGCCLDREPVPGSGIAGSGFPCWGGKKMVVVDWPSAATWTQFAAPGGGGGGSGAVGRNQKQMGAGILGPGTRSHTQHGSPLPAWVPGCMPAPGALCAEHRARAAHPGWGPWVSSSSRLSLGRCSSLAEMPKQNGLEGVEMVFLAESSPPPPASRRSPARQRRQAWSHGTLGWRWGRAPGERARGLPGEGLQAAGQARAGLAVGWALGVRRVSRALSGVLWLGGWHVSQAASASRFPSAHLWSRGSPHPLFLFPQGLVRGIEVRD